MRADVLPFGRTGSRHPGVDRSVFGSKAVSFARVQTVLIVVLFTLLTLFTMSSLVGDHILGHDESVYASEARSWIEGTPSEQFEIYRPIAMPVIGWLTLQVSNSERAFRIFGVLFGAITPGIIFLLFRRTGNLWIAFITATIVAASPLFLRQAPQYLNDIPSAILLVAILYIVYDHFESAGRSRLLYWIAPLAAFAFYMRYAAITPIAMVALFSYLLLLPRFLKKQGHDFSIIGRTILLSLVFFLPHFVYSIIATHKPFGILSLAGRAAHRAYIGDGLLQYIRWWPQDLGGWIFGIAAFAGVIATCAFLFHRKLRNEYIAFAWIGGIGLGTFLMTGLLTHAEPRYVFFPLILLAGTGVAGIYFLVASYSRFAAQGTMAALLIIAVYMGMSDYKAQYAFFADEELAPYNVASLRAYAAINADKPEGTPCNIWTAFNRPRASWYTECNIFKITDDEQFLEDASPHLNETLYSIVANRMREPQISLDTATHYGVTLTEIFRTTDLASRTRGDVIVYRMTKNTSASAAISTTTTSTATTTTATSTQP